jgi:ribosomal protein S7
MARSVRSPVLPPLREEEVISADFTLHLLTSWPAESAFITKKSARTAATTANSSQRSSATSCWMARNRSPSALSIRAIEQLNDKTDSVDPLELFNRAIENTKPRVEVKARRVGGATYQVPLEVSPRRQESLAMRWIVGYARNRKGQAMHRALANELKDAANKGRGMPSASATTFTSRLRPTAPSLTSASNRFPPLFPSTFRFSAHVQPQFPQPRIPS